MGIGSRSRVGRQPHRVLLTQPRSQHGLAVATLGIVNRHRRKLYIASQQLDHAFSLADVQLRHGVRDDRHTMHIIGGQISRRTFGRHGKTIAAIHRRRHQWVVISRPDAEVEPCPTAASLTVPPANLNRRPHAWPPTARVCRAQATTHMACSWPNSSAQVDICGNGCVSVSRRRFPM